MTNYLSQITPEMVATVDRLKANNFENATPDEIELYAEFSRLTGLHDEELQQRAAERKAEADERRELFRQQAQSAMNALDSLAQLAQVKLKAIENGTEVI